MRRKLPAGTVTFLFTDVEGSTKLLHELGAEDYAHALAEHRRVLRALFSAYGGVEVDTQGDAFFAVFPTAGDAVRTAAEAAEALRSGPLRVRMGLHTGTPHLGPEGYVGEDVHKGARIAAAGHGGQILLSKETRELVHVEVTDLGEHRVKDFDEPVWVFQLGSRRFPPLKTISNTNLPRPASSFVGREREVEGVVALFKEGARLVTLTGAGGSGKTRLAIEAAAELVPAFQNGVCWVGLAALRDPELVSDEIALALGAKDGLAAHIGQRELLLLLDNFEQVIAAAPELAALVEACPKLRLLVTSRELLRVRGEVEFAVLPLAEPEAVELFCARSRLAPDAAVRDLCRALDNLPLALELAAARASVLSPKQILERLSARLDLLKGGRDVGPRQATLRATMDWSHSLLDESDRRLFARLAVFAGGYGLEAAEEVTEATVDGLQSLVGKSLLRHTEQRFWMLETIREFAVERLEDSGESDVFRRRHAEYFLELAEKAEPHLFSESPADWLDLLERETDNIRAALDTFEGAGETECVLRLAGALAEFWGSRANVSEGRRRLESALAADDRQTRARGKALNAASDLAVGAGDLATATLRAEEGLALHRELGDRWGTAGSLSALGAAAGNQGDFARARDLLDESARLFQEIGDEHSSLFATHLLAWAHREAGDLGRARAMNEENLRRARSVGDKAVEAISLEALAGQARDEGKTDEALRLLKEAYGVRRAVGDIYWDAIAVCRFARLLAAAGRLEPAARVLSSSEALLREMGAAPPFIIKMNQETWEMIRAGVDEATLAEACRQGETMNADEAIALALDSLEPARVDGA